MRVIILGATGTIGGAIGGALEERHQVVGSSRHSEHRADLASEESLRALLDVHTPFDAVICAAGETPFAPLASLDADALVEGLHIKLHGQISLARLAFELISDGGSVTLTSGVLNHRPIAGSACAAIANGALEGYVRAAAKEAPRGVRINLVSPGVLEESWERHGSYFRGFAPVAARAVAEAYVRSVEGDDSGRIFNIHEPEPAG